LYELHNIKSISRTPTVTSTNVSDAVML